MTVPSVVQKDVYVDGMVSDATRAFVTTVALERVERLMVDDPITTSLLADPVRVDTPLFVEPPATADVVIRLVTAEPCELVVVTSIVVGTVDEGACDVSSADVGVVCAVFEVGVDSGVADVSCVGSDVGEADVGVVSCVSLVGVADSEVAMLVLEVTPVPTTCLFCGTMPAGMSSARTCAKPRLKRASIFACSDG